MTSTPEKSKSTDNSKVSEEKKDDSAHHLGVLEEDDEFEEFVAAGATLHHRTVSYWLKHTS